MTPWGHVHRKPPAAQIFPPSTPQPCSAVTFLSPCPFFDVLQGLGEPLLPWVGLPYHLAMLFYDDLQPQSQARSSNTPWLKSQKKRKEVILAGSVGLWWWRPSVHTRAFEWSTVMLKRYNDDLISYFRFKETDLEYRLSFIDLLGMLDGFKCSIFYLL